MVDSDSAAMARLAAENEDDEVNLEELEANRAAQGQRQENESVTSTTTVTSISSGGGSTKRSGNLGFQSLIKTTSSSAPSVDEPSKKGQFGWFAVVGVQLPYITRDETTYIPVKVVEKSVFGELLNEVPVEAIECAKIEAATITEAEAKLLNEINMKHSEGSFGKEVFSQRDKMIERDQFEKFVEYLLFCRKVLVLKENSTEEDRCGMVRIKSADGDVNFFPFTLLAGSKWVPLSYFEGDLGHLKSGAKTIRSWELTYLKLASRITTEKQNIEGLSCQVVRLDTVLGCYPSKPKVEHIWKIRTFMERANYKSSTATWTTMSQTGPRRKYSGKLTLIKEFPISGNGPAYKVIPVQLEGCQLIGLNVKPLQWHDLFIPLQDLVAVVVPGLGVEEAGQLLSEKGTNLFRGNQGQALVMETEGKAAQWDPVPLVRLGDAKKHLAMLKDKAAQPPSKRSKLE